MTERVAWSAAFHGKSINFDPGQFVQDAENYSARLAEIDLALREPEAPIIGFMSGPAGDYREDPNAIRYAYRVGDGTGLSYTQHYNEQRGRYQHGVVAAERKLTGRPNTLLNRSDEPLISRMSPDELVQAVHTPVDVALTSRYAK